MAFRALLFDVGETLWHAPAPPPPAEFRRIAAERVAPVFARAGIPDDQLFRASRVAWDAIDPAIRAARQGDLREPDYADVVRDALEQTGVSLDRSATVELLDAIYVSGLEAGKIAYRDARSVLEELKKRGFLLSTATNRAFGGQRFRQDLADCGIDVGWDAHSVSVEVGHLKPHPAVFEHAMAELNVRPEETLMIGNSLLEDIAGAQRLGIAAAWRRCKPDAQNVVPDYAFDELTELLDIPELGAACG